MAGTENNYSGSKCCAYLVVSLLLLCLALLVFALVLVQIQTPIIKIDSVVVKSAKYDLYPHLFLKLNMVMRIYFKNHAYGHMRLNGKTSLELHYGAASVIGLTELKLRRRVKAREHEVIEVKMKATSSVSEGGSGLKKVDQLKLNQDLRSGFVSFNAKAAIKTKVYWIKNKITSSTEARMNCDVVINLKQKTVQKLTCY